MPNLLLDPLPDVLAQKGGGRSQLYDHIKRGTWPPPVHSGRGSFWPRHETQTLVGARIAGATEEQLRAIVCQLLEQRKAMMPRLEPLSGAAPPEAAPEIDASASCKRNTPKRPGRRSASV